MRRIKAGRWAVAIITLCCAHPVVGHEFNDPTWLLMEVGRRRFHEREYGEALRIFREVKSRTSISPEVDIAIGEVFEAEGEIEIALQQYGRALAQSNLLSVPDDVIPLLMRMATLHEMNGDLLSYEEFLGRVIEQDAERAEIARFEEAAVRVLVRDGVDTLLSLYRFNDGGSSEAYVRLGRFYLYDSGRYFEATRVLTVAVVVTLSEIAEYMLARDATFRFDSVEELLQRAARHRQVSRFVAESDLYGQLYMLGHSLDASGRVGPAEALRLLLLRIDENGPTGIRVSRDYPAL